MCSPLLDELPEFQRNILEALRQPIETGQVHVARAKGTLTFPSKFSLVAAMNPCPCGFHGDPDKQCRCSAYDVIRYQKKISGPLLDRIDLQVRVARIKLDEIRAKAPTTESPRVKDLVERVRTIQASRFIKSKIRTNSEMSSKQAEQFALMDTEAEKFLSSIHRSNISPRGYYRLLKTARTIADLEDSTGTTAEHLAEAWSYRLKEEI